MKILKLMLQAVLPFSLISVAQATTSFSVHGQWTVGYDMNNVAHTPAYFGIDSFVAATTSFEEGVRIELPTVSYQNQITYYTGFGSAQSSTLSTGTFTSSFSPQSNSRVTVEFSLFGNIAQSPSQAMIFINGQRRDIFADGSFTDTNLAIYRQFTLPDAPRFTTSAELGNELNHAFTTAATWTLSGNSYTWLNGQQLSGITMYGTATITQYGVSSPIPEVPTVLALSFGLAGLALARRRLTPRSS